MTQIYALLDPRTNEVRYIGKANVAAERLKSHLRDSKRRRTPVYSWIGSLLANGFAPKLRVLCECAEADWPHLERALIAAGRGMGMRLLNIAEGGNEPLCSAGTRASNGQLVAKLRASTPQRQRVYELKREVGRLLKAGAISASNMAKLRLAAQKAPHLFGQWASI